MTYYYLQDCKFNLLGKTFMGEFSETKNKIFANFNYLEEKNRPFVNEVFEKYKPQNNYIYPICFFLKNRMEVNLDEIKRLKYPLPKFELI